MRGLNAGKRELSRAELDGLIEEAKELASDEAGGADDRGLHRTPPVGETAVYQDQRVGLPCRNLFEHRRQAGEGWFHFRFALVARDSFSGHCRARCW